MERSFSKASAEIGRPVRDEIGSVEQRSDPILEEYVGKLGNFATGACMCKLQELASSEGLLEATKGLPVITIEGEEFNVPEALVEWLNSNSCRSRDLAKRVDAWRRLADLFWEQESRIDELLEQCVGDPGTCPDTDCRERLEIRRHLLGKLWKFASAHRMEARRLSRDPEDRPYAAYRYSA